MSKLSEIRYKEIMNTLYLDIWNLLRQGLSCVEVAMVYNLDKDVAYVIYLIWKADFNGSCIYLEGESIL